MRHPKLAAVSICATAIVFGLNAADSWVNKDYKQWSADDVQRVLTNSPWATRTSATVEGNSMEAANGSGYPNSGGTSNGGGYPNGSGYPNSTGYPGGGGMGGGGMGRMGGMGGGGMGGQGGGMGRGRNRQMNSQISVLVRWDSSMPVKEALMRQQFDGALPQPGDANYTLDREEKNYLISVIGLHAPSRSISQDDDSGAIDGNTSHLRNVLLASAQLSIKNKSSINPEDVKVTQQNDGTDAAQFFFPRSTPIDLDDKEVTFTIQTGQMKVERKFKLKEMVYNGKLSL